VNQGAKVVLVQPPVLSRFCSSCFSILEVPLFAGAHDEVEETGRKREGKGRPTFFRLYLLFVLSICQITILDTFA
jgi:hypothetical protein